MNDFKPLAGSDDDIHQLAQPVFAQIMAAHEEADYAALLPCLSAAMREALDEETFEQIVSEHLASLGELVGTQYLGSLQKADATQVLWKARYDQTETELLWQVFLAQDGDQVLVVGLLFS